MFSFQNDTKGQRYRPAIHGQQYIDWVKIKGRLSYDLNKATRERIEAWMTRGKQDHSDGKETEFSDFWCGVVSATQSFLHAGDQRKEILRLIRDSIARTEKWNIGGMPAILGGDSIERISGADMVTEAWSAPGGLMLRIPYDLNVIDYSDQIDHDPVAVADSALTEWAVRLENFAFKLRRVAGSLQGDEPKEGKVIAFRNRAE